MKLIDGDELIELLLSTAITDKQREYSECVQYAVQKMPPVDAVPARHGKWVDENGNRPYGYRFNWLCSECGRPQHTSTAKLLKEFEEEHRWCHFCGARMDGKDGDHAEGTV